MPNIFESSKIAIAKKATEIASDLGNTIGWGGATSTVQSYLSRLEMYIMISNVSSALQKSYYITCI